MKVKLECAHPIFLKEIGITVGCGNCPVCRKRQQDDWYVRLRSEFENCHDALWFTLTYNEAHVPYKEIHYALDVDGNRFQYSDVDEDDIFAHPYSQIVQTFRKSDVQNFLKRIREEVGYRQFKYFIVGEYTPDYFRPHYHGIIFDLGKENWPLIEKHWKKYGFIKKGRLKHDGAIRYVSKYCISNTMQPEIYSFKCMKFRTMASRGIGLKAITPELEEYWHSTLNPTIRVNGYSYALPRYLRNKIFTDEEKLELLDKYKEHLRQYQDWYNRKFVKTGYDNCTRTRKQEVRDEFLKKTRIKMSKRNLKKDESVQLNSHQNSKEK